MNKKDKFIKVLEDLFSSMDIVTFCGEDYEDVMTYFEALKVQEENNKPKFTDNGKLILGYMKEHQNEKMWKAKDIAEGLVASPKMVSGAIRKLVTDGYVEKLGEKPSVYALTEEGKNINVE